MTTLAALPSPMALGPWVIGRRKRALIGETGEMALAGVIMIEVEGVVITAVAGVMLTGVPLYELEGVDMYALRVVTVGGVWRDPWRAVVGVGT